MKPISSKTFQRRVWCRRLGHLIALAPVSLHAVDNLWTGIADTDWNNPANWSDPHAFGSTHVPTNAAGHPGDEDAAVNTITPNIATITADISATPRDIKVGAASGATGQINHHAGLASTGADNWMIVGSDGGSGTYNLANTAATGGVLTGFGSGSGSAYAGQLRVGRLGGATGVMAINTTGTLTVKNDIFVGEGATGTIKMDAGTVNRNTGWSAIGVGGGTGTFNQSGGIFTGANETVVGLNLNSNGLLNLSGGIYNAGGIVQIGRDQATGTMTVSGASILEAQTEIWIGENPGSNGTLTVSSGTVNVASWIAVGRNGSNGTLTISGTGTVNQGLVTTDSRLSMTNFGQPTTATVNLDGGTLSTRGIIDEAGGTTTVNLNGGLLKPAMNHTDFIDNVNSVVVGAGGAKFDTNGFTISINEPLTGAAGDGGLVKSGSGELFLNAANTYIGDTSVTGGTLGGDGSINGSVSVASGAILSPGDPVGVLTAASVSFASGSTLAIDVEDAATPAADRLNVTGSLTIGTGTTLEVADSLSSRVYIVAGYGSRTGTFTTPTLPAGYSINYTFNGNQIAITRAANAFDNFIDPLFPANPNDPAFVGPNADPDGDGATNSEEFALGGNPALGGDRPKVFPLVADSSDAGTARELLLTIAVRNGGDGIGGTPVFSPAAGGTPTATVDGITYTIEGSTDLLTFQSPVSVVTPVTTGLPTVPSGYEYRTFRLDVSDGLGSRGFLRVRTSP